MTDLTDDRPEAQALMANLKAKLPELVKLLDKVGEAGEDEIYRFYHTSFKVYGLQNSTQAIVAALQSLAPDRPLNEMFAQIVAEGTGKKWIKEHNKRWVAETRPILEAFFHSLYFLKMAVKYGRQLSKPPAMMPSGWAALLYLYGLR